MIGFDDIKRMKRERGPRYLVVGTVRADEFTAQYADSSQAAEDIKLRMEADGLYTVRVILPSVHRATPVHAAEHAEQHCSVCGQWVKRVPGGQGPTWVHRDSGAVAAPSPPFVSEEEKRAEDWSE